VKLKNEGKTYTGVVL